jgi:A/G-specific adenine glycosylase
VLELWSGLGYPRRAVSLRRAAGEILRHHRGAVPASFADLFALPGVGHYTARAVLAFAFEWPVVPLDTNVSRVVARAVAGEPLSRSGGPALADRLATGALSGRDRALALMDLGAVVCNSRRPDCDACPLGDAGAAAPCRWRAVGGDDPARARPGHKAAPRFEGSDRQGRGRLLRAAAAGVLGDNDLATAAGWPDDRLRAARVADLLVADGLLERVAGLGYRLAD